MAARCRSPPQQQIVLLRRAVLLAAAVGRDSLAPGHRHCEALSQVDRMVIATNPRDRVLRFFPVLADDGDEALGLSGPTGLSRMGELRSRVVLLSVTPFVHHHHQSVQYMKSPEILACIRDEVLTAGLAAGAPKPLPPPDKTAALIPAAGNSAETDTK